MGKVGVKKTMPGSEQVNLRLERRMYDKLKEIVEAEEGYTSLQDLIRDILRDWLKKREKLEHKEAEVTA